MDALRFLAGLSLLALLTLPGLAAAAPAGMGGGYALEGTGNPSETTLWHLAVVDRSGSLVFSDAPGRISLLSGAGADEPPEQVWTVSDSRLTGLAALEGGRVAWTDAGGRVGLLNLTGGQASSRQASSHGLTHLALSPQGGLLAAGDEAGNLYLLAAEDLEPVRTLKVTAAMVTRLAFSPEGNLLAVGDGEGVVTLYETEDWTLSHRLKTGRGWVTALSFWTVASQANLMVGVSAGELLLYPLADVARPLTHSLSAWANDMAVLDTPGWLAVGQQDGVVALFTSAGYRNLTLRQQLVTQGAVYSLAGHLQGHGLLTGGARGALSRWVLDSDGDNVGDLQDPFPALAGQWSDADGDGWGDNPFGELADAFPQDAAASRDSDDDSFPDAWNPGQGLADSTTGLTLDLFPNNPDEWRDSDGDGVGDNSDPWPNYILVSQAWHISAIGVLLFTAMNLALHSGWVNLDSRWQYKQLRSELDPPRDPGMARALPEAGHDLARARRCLSRGRSYAARRVLNRLNNAHEVLAAQMRQAKAELKAARRDLARWSDRGFACPEDVLAEAEQALAAGDYKQARELAGQRRAALNEQFTRRLKARELRSAPAAPTRSAAAATAPAASAPSLASALASSVSIPAARFDWQNPRATPPLPAPQSQPQPQLQPQPQSPAVQPASPTPQPASPGPETPGSDAAGTTAARTAEAATAAGAAGAEDAATKVVNISLTDCIINRSDLGLLAEGEADGSGA